MIIQTIHETKINENINKNIDKNKPNNNRLQIFDAKWS